MSNILVKVEFIFDLFYEVMNTAQPEEHRVWLHGGKYGQVKITCPDYSTAKILATGIADSIHKEEFPDKKISELTHYTYRVTIHLANFAYDSIETYKVQP